MRTARGFTLLELMVAGVILAIILAVVGNYFVQQTDLSRRTQARSEVQDKVRMVMQVVTQDLQLAGGATYSDAAGTILPTAVSLGSCPFDADSGENTCLRAGNGNGDERDVVSVVYINSLRSTAEACREVGYRVTDNGTLERADVGCTTPVALLDPDTDGNNYQPLASNILALDVQYVCTIKDPSSGDFIRQPSYPPDRSACPLGASYVRSAVVSVIGRSDVRVGGAPQETYTTATGKQVSCEPDFICFALTQEILLPNLKDR